MKRGYGDTAKEQMKEQVNATEETIRDNGPLKR